MALNTEEFVNPKSMITPGFAATAVASIAGAMFSMFGVALPAALIILSFFVASAVFHSKEFADPETRKVVKFFYYVLNALIIFAMATGAHSVLDKAPSKPGIRSSMLFVSSAYAQGTRQAKSAIKQARPFFHDWTKDPSPPANLDDTGIIKFRAEKDFGAVKGVFVAARLAVPDYRVRVEIDKSNLRADVESVTWLLPPEYFAEDRVVVRNQIGNFGVTVDAWKPFLIGAEIELQSGKKLRVEKFISFDTKKN